MINVCLVVVQTAPVKGFTAIGHVLIRLTNGIRKAEKVFIYRIFFRIFILFDIFAVHFGGYVLCYELTIIMNSYFAFNSLLS